MSQNIENLTNTFLFPLSTQCHHCVAVFPTEPRNWIADPHQWWHLTSSRTLIKHVSGSCIKWGKLTSENKCGPTTVWKVMRTSWKINPPLNIYMICLHCRQKSSSEKQVFSVKMCCHVCTLLYIFGIVSLGPIPSIISRSKRKCIHKSTRDCQIRGSNILYSHQQRVSMTGSPQPRQLNRVYTFGWYQSDR